MDENQDRQIAQGLLEGKPEAFHALYDAHYEQVWRCVSRLIGACQADVGDVVQETFLTAARSARTYDPSRGSLWLWLSGIARRRAGDYFRNWRRDQRIAPGGDLASDVARRLTRWLDASDQSPPDALISAEVALLVRTALFELSDDYQSLLCARYCDDVSTEDLARGRGCTAESIRSKLVRARRAFRDAFARIAPSERKSQGGES